MQAQTRQRERAVLLCSMQVYSTSGSSVHRSTRRPSVPWIYLSPMSYTRDLCQLPGRVAVLPVLACADACRSVVLVRTLYTLVLLVCTCPGNTTISPLTLFRFSHCLASMHAMHAQMRSTGTCTTSGRQPAGGGQPSISGRVPLMRGTHRRRTCITTAVVRIKELQMAMCSLNTGLLHPRVSR